MIDFIQPTTAAEYRQLVEHFSFLVDAEFKKFENINSSEEAHTAALEAPKLVSLVNTIGYLRGQDNAFLDVRPHEVVEYQKELYANEDGFEDRLKELLKKIVSFGKTDVYNYYMNEYFIKSRSI